VRGFFFGGGRLYFPRGNRVFGLLFFKRFLIRRFVGCLHWIQNIDFFVYRLPGHSIFPRGSFFCNTSTGRGLSPPRCGCVGGPETPVGGVGGWAGRELWCVLFLVRGRPVSGGGLLAGSPLSPPRTGGVCSAPAAGGTRGCGVPDKKKNAFVVSKGVPAGAWGTLLKPATADLEIFCCGHPAFAGGLGSRIGP